MSSSSSATATASGGTSMLGLLGIVLTIAKLAGYLTWPWVWVLAPFWIPAALLLVVLFFLLAFALLLR